MQLKVTVPLLNKRNLIPLSLPDAANIAGVVKEGFTFQGEEVDISQLPNPAMGKWYRDRDGYFYWGGGVMEVTGDFELAKRRSNERAIAEVLTAAIEPSKLGWGLKMLYIEKFWEQAGNMGNDINIAILDTGISSSHPDFDYSKIEHFNIIDGSINTEDISGHGTHIAGIIVAQGKKVVGAAPDSRLLVIKIADQAEGWKIENVAKGIIKAIEMGADIISISGEFHSLNSKLPLLKEAVLSAYQKGIIIVASAGNNFSTLPSDYYPASFDECISVGSIKEDKTRADYSNLSTKLDIVCPGHHIFSTWKGDAYNEDSGTSMATPLMAGIIAILKSFARTQNQKDLSPDEIYLILTKTAEDAGQPNHDIAYGFGIVNPQKALNLI